MIFIQTSQQTTLGLKESDSACKSYSQFHQRDPLAGNRHCCCRRQEATLAFTLLRQQSADRALLLSGNIEAHQSVLSFKMVQSRIVELPFDEGQWVEGGAPLARLDDSNYRQQVAIDEAFLHVQEQQLAATLQDLEAARRTVESDKAEQLRDVRAVLARAEGILSVVLVDDGVHLVVDDAERRVPELRQRLRAAGLPFGQIARVPPTIEDLFVAAVQTQMGAAQ